MEQTIVSNHSSFASLLMLNNDILIDIFQFLQLDDYVNLAKSCKRLRQVVVYDRKFRSFEIEIHDYYNQNYTQLISVNEFFEICGIIGGQIWSLSLTVNSIKDISAILETIRRDCKKLKKIEINAFGLYPGLIVDFTNLKELKFDVSLVSVATLRNCIANNPDLESITFNERLPSANLQEHADLLELLPKLTCFSFSMDYFVSLNYFRILDRLTRITFECGTSCDELLTELSKRSIVEELNITADISSDTFNIIKSFEKLQILRVVNLASKRERNYDQTTLLPANLKHFGMARFNMDNRSLLSIIEQLKFLEEVDVFFCNFGNNRTSIINDYPMEFAEISKELRVRKQILKIYLPALYQEHDSDHLKFFDYPSAETVIKKEPGKVKIEI